MSENNSEYDSLILIIMSKWKALIYNKPMKYDPALHFIFIILFILISSMNFASSIIMETSLVAIFTLCFDLILTLLIIMAIISFFYRIIIPTIVDIIINDASSQTINYDIV